MDEWLHIQDEYGRHLLGGGGYDTSNEDRLAWLGDNVKVFEWLAFSASISLFVVYVRERMYNNSCPWEVIFVAFIEAMHYLVDMNFHGDSAATINLSNGQQVYWIRYAGWLLTCPVILIHLSHTPEENDQVLTHNLLFLLTSNQAMILFGVTASFGQAGTRTLFFLLSCVGFAILCRTAASIYFEALRVYPSSAKLTLKVTAGLFFCTWSLYPVFWLMGPEGFKVIRLETSSAFHAVTDLFAKNLWGYLMFRVREFHLEGVAHQMGITAAEYIRQRKCANLAVDNQFEEWTTGCIAGDAKEVTINVTLQTPKFKAKPPPNKGPKRRASILNFPEWNLNGSFVSGAITPSKWGSQKSSIDFDPFEISPKGDKLPANQIFPPEQKKPPLAPSSTFGGQRQYMNDYDDMTPKQVADKLSKLQFKERRDAYVTTKKETESAPAGRVSDENHTEMTRGERLTALSSVPEINMSAPRSDELL